MASPAISGRTPIKTIQEAYLLSGSDTDILKAPSRLQSSPDNALLVIDLSATKCDETNQGKISVTTPDGELPIDGQLIGANGFSDSNGLIHAETADRIIVPIQQGGHILVAYQETGETIVFARFTLYF